MTAVFDLANKYVEEKAALDPWYATIVGVEKYDRKLPDYSPDGVQAGADLNVRYRALMNTAVAEGHKDEITKRVFDERISVMLHEAESGEALRRLSTMWSPMQRIREAFDLLPRDTTEQWKTIAARMAEVPASIRSLQSALQYGQQQGMSAARRQALACGLQARTWAGLGGGGRYFDGLAQEFSNRGTSDRKVEDALRKAARTADAAYGEFSAFLLDDYAPNAPEADGTGRERYAHLAEDWLGLKLDVDGAYDWGWAELRRVRADIETVVAKIAPGSTYRECVGRLDADHERSMAGGEAVRDWLQALMTRTIERLDGTHFDIPKQLRRIEVRLAPRGTAAAQYYLAPSDDFTRPGTYWFPTSDRTRFPVWNEISTAYHEGVPGHHLMQGWQVAQGSALSAYQRHLNVGGHSQGWAMYGERLMGELGYFDRPEYELDMLSNSLLRAARVVIDIGLHAGLPIPDDEPVYGGQHWTPALAADFLLANSSESTQFVQSEITRYLGLPGQALTYKLGEAVWLEARRYAQKTEGSAFDLRAFHTRALNVGPMGLAQLREELIPSAV